MPQIDSITLIIRIGSILSRSAGRTAHPAGSRFDKVVQAISLLLLTSAAGAQSLPGEPTFTFNGYGTLGVVRSSEHSADFTSSPLHVRDGAGHTDNWSAKVDSRLALQAEARFSPHVGGVVQVITEQQHDGRFTPAFEWAYLQIEATPNLAFKAGRIVLPALLTSGYRKAGFATPWVRPPQEVYQLIPATHFDGVDVIWSQRLGAVTNNLQLATGTNQRKLAGGFNYEVKNGVVLADTAEIGALTLFASIGEVSYTAKAPQELTDFLATFAPEAAATANSGDEEMRFRSIGFRYDPGTWLAMGESIWSRSSASGDADGWYVTGGYRFGAWTPYATLAAHDVRSGILGLRNLPVSQLGQIFSPLLASILSVNYEQQRVSIGLRWDIFANLALKMEYDHVDLKDNAVGFQTNLQPGFRGGEDFSVFSAAIDFVF